MNGQHNHDEGGATRPTDTIGRITVDPHVMLGKPCVAGTRITVELILEEFAAGTTTQELLAAYPHLGQADIQAALDYALRAIRHEEVRPLPGGAR
jgi:uncharacterized protein (DUF433 family)